MMNAKLINRYVYTIDSVIRLRDQMIYEAKVEKKRVKDSIKVAENLALYNKWINYKLKNKKRN
jgi:hypothetical protein